jgi:hypothetical protein
MRRFLLSLLLVSGISLGLDPAYALGDKPSAQTVKTTQADLAKQAANSIQFTDNAEIANIRDRIELTSKPGLLGYVILLNESGQPILYEGVKGKITSGGKRLTNPVQKYRMDLGQAYGETLNVAPSDEGTWGGSGEYVFYWNTDGVYRQWNGKYLYSTQPFRLSVQPLVVNINAGK